METIQEIFIDCIDDPKDAMRTELDRNQLFELADNIKQNGLINPITVRPKGDRFEVVAGHRRLSACKIAGKIKIQCVVRDLDDSKTFEVMAAENLERSDVDVVDESIFITRFMEQTQKTPEEVAKQLRRSLSWIDSRLAVGAMPDYMQAYLKSGDLKLGAALWLVQIDDDAMRHVWVDMAARDGVSVAQAKYWYEGWKLTQLPGNSSNGLPPEGYVAGSPTLVTFKCAIDGCDYDARQFRTVLIHESNLDGFNEYVTAFRELARSA